ncbi:MAG: hypothetical protein R6U13_08930 [Desulfatiglandaceae bacterium]
MSSEIIVVERDLLKSKAFRPLSGTAKTVLFDFLMKRKVKGKGAKITILNNGELQYSYADANKNGIPPTSFMRALDQVIAHGFIDVAWSGSGGKKGDVSLYAISDRWRAFGTDHFQPATRPKDNRQGRGFQPGNEAWKRSKNSTFAAENGKPTIAENGKPKGKVTPLNRQKRQTEKEAKTAETLVDTS